MRRSSRARTVAKGAEHDFPYQPTLSAALLALALAICLMWHGMARADDFATPDDDDVSQPAPSQSVLDSPGCTDDMDFSPEDNLPSPFDADKAAFHSRLSVRLAQPTALDNGCPSPGAQPVLI